MDRARGKNSSTSHHTPYSRTASGDLEKECEYQSFSFQPSQNQLARQLAKWGLRVYASRGTAVLSGKPLQDAVEKQSQSSLLHKGCCLPTDEPFDQIIRGNVTRNSSSAATRQDLSLTAAARVRGIGKEQSSPVLQVFSSTGLRMANTDEELFVLESVNERRDLPHHMEDQIPTHLLLSTTAESIFSTLRHVSKDYDPFIDIATLHYNAPFDLRWILSHNTALESLTSEDLEDISLVADCLSSCGLYCESFEVSYFVAKHPEASYASSLSWRTKAAIDCARSCVTFEQCEYTKQLLEYLIIGVESTATNDAALIVLSVYLIDLYESRNPGSSRSYINRLLKYTRLDQQNLPDIDPSSRLREHFSLKYKLDNRTLPVDIPFMIGSSHANSMIGDSVKPKRVALLLLDWCSAVLNARVDKFERTMGSGGLNQSQCATVLFHEFVEVWHDSALNSSSTPESLTTLTEGVKTMLRRSYWAFLSEFDALTTLAWLLASEVTSKVGFYRETNSTLAPPRRSLILCETTIELLDCGPSLPQKFRDMYLCQISPTLAQRRGMDSDLKGSCSSFGWLDFSQRPCVAVIEEFSRVVRRLTKSKAYTEARSGLSPKLAPPHHSDMPSISEDAQMAQSEYINTFPLLSSISRRSSLSSGFRILAVRLKRRSTIAGTRSKGNLHRLM